MKQKKKIVIINPSGSEEMTQDIARAARSYAAGRFEVIAIAINGMKKFIDYEVDIKDALPDMAQIVKDYETEADAFLVSCHLHQAPDRYRGGIHSPCGYDGIEICHYR